MLDLRGLEDWFFNNTKRISTTQQGPYWTLRRDHGRTVYTNLEVDDPQESYRMLCDYIENQALNGAREFEVWFKLSKTDPSKTSFVIRVPYGYQGKSGDSAAAVAGLYGLPSPAASPAIGQLMEQRMNERLEAQQREFQMQLDRLREQHENEKRFGELEGSLQAMIESKKTFADKLIERLEEQPQVLEKLIDAIGPGIRGVVSQLFPQVGVAGAQFRSEVPAAPLDLSSRSTIHKNMEHREQPASDDSQPGIDFNPAIQAFLNLHQAGFPDAAGDILRLSGAAASLAQVEGFEDDPVGVIEAVVNFVTSNPGQAKMLLGQLK